jgi:hypothetical protein
MWHKVSYRKEAGSQRRNREWQTAWLLEPVIGRKMVLRKHENGEGMLSSVVQRVLKKNQMLYIETRNSLYVAELLGATRSDDPGVWRRLNPMSTPTPYEVGKRKETSG